MVWFNVLTASLLLGLASFGFCIWYVPWIRRWLQVPIESQIRRAGEIGFSADLLRQIEFALELFLIALVAWASRAYLGPILTMVICLILVHLRSLVLMWIIESRERLLRAQTLSFTSSLVGLTRGGLGLAQSFDAIAAETPKPLGDYVLRITREHQRGRPFAEAIQSVRSQLQLDAFSLLVTSIQCAFKQGSSLENALLGVQEGLEHRQQSEHQLQSKTANARMTILILAATTPCFLLLFGLLMPSSMQLIFLTSHGKILIAVVLLLMYGGVAWSRQLLALR